MDSEPRHYFVATSFSSTAVPDEAGFLFIIPDGNIHRRQGYMFQKRKAATIESYELSSTAFPLKYFLDNPTLYREVTRDAALTYMIALLLVDELEVPQ